MELYLKHIPILKKEANQARQNISDNITAEIFQSFSVGAQFSGEANFQCTFSVKPDIIKISKKGGTAVIRFE